MLTLAEAAAFYLASAARCEAYLVDVVEGVVSEGAERARVLIGHEHDYWPALSGATVYGFRHPRVGWIPGKEDLGYGGFESPLLRTGQMRDSIEFSVVGLVGEVGSNDKRALWMELGAASAFGFEPTPPRPFLSKGLLESAAAMFEPLMLEVLPSLLIPPP